MQGKPSFRQVLVAVTDTWLNRGDEVTSSAFQVVQALAEASAQPSGANALPDSATLNRAVAELAAYEETTHDSLAARPSFRCRRRSVSCPAGVGPVLIDPAPMPSPIILNPTLTTRSAHPQADGASPLP